MFDLTFKDFDDQFPLVEFGEDIIKAVYTFLERDNKKEKYTDFRAAVEDCITKDLILAKSKETNEVVESDDWLDGINLEL